MERDTSKTPRAGAEDHSAPACHVMKSTLALVLAGFLCTAVIGLHAPAPLHAHGALIDYTVARSIVVHARYDNGQPMSEAQITVFAPDNPAKAWLTGITDQEGLFSFVPDPSIPGTWAVQARQAGHGAMVHITIDASGDAQQAMRDQGPGATGLQRGLMAAAIVWGFIGTALFFSRRRTR
jgi:nickel transport protein